MTNSTNEIQVESLIAIAPKIAELYNKLSEPMVPIDKIQEFYAVPPAMKSDWVSNNANNLNVDLAEQINSIMFDLINAMNPIIGAKKVQGVMAVQQQQSLQQAAQKPAPKATAPVESLE
jgi:hypothetical protein